MKIIALISLFFMMNLSFAAKDSKQTFGKGADMTKLTPISKVLSTPTKFVKTDVTIEGTIVDVCTKRGCWMKLASDKRFQTLRIKVRDGDMVFPLTSKGKKAYATGKLSGKQLSKEKAIEYLSYLAKESSEKFDPSSVKGPLMIYQLIPNGVTIN